MEKSKKRGDRSSIYTKAEVFSMMSAKTFAQKWKRTYRKKKLQHVVLRQTRFRKK